MISLKYDTNSERTGNIFGSLTTHDGRSFNLEKCKSGYMWIEFGFESLPEKADDSLDKLLPEEVTRKRRSTRYQELVEKGKADNTTMATYSIMIYYTEEFADITEDVSGRIEHTIAVLNEGYANSEIPLTATIHCIEPAYFHDKGGSELIVDLHNLFGGDMNMLRRGADAAHLLSGLTTGYGGVGWFGRIESGEMVSYAEAGKSNDIRRLNNVRIYFRKIRQLVGSRLLMKLATTLDWDMVEVIV